MSVLTEGRHAAEFIMGEAEFGRSRENIAIAAGAGVIAPGTVLGMIELAGEATEDHAGNTGNGAMTLADPAIGPGAKAGDYLVTMKGGTFAAAVTDVVGAGKGALTMANPAFAAGVKLGDYRVTIIEAAENAGTFVVEDPDGIEVGSGTAGVAFTGIVKFTLADGSSDFVAGDVAIVTISPAIPANGLAAFSVVDPDGVALADGVVGTAYVGPINFTIADGGENFILDDLFTVTVEGVSERYVPAPLTADDGSDVPKAINIYGVDAGTDDEADDVLVAALARDATVNGHILSYAASVNDAGKKAGKNAALAAVGIIVR